MSDYLLSFHGALLALLRRLEWSGKGRQYDDGTFADVCPVCHGGVAHKADCELNQTIEALIKLTL